MALTGKKQKKLGRWIRNTEDKFNLIVTDKVIEYFVLLCFVLLFDRIADMFRLFAFINYHKGVGALQIGVAVVCIIQMVRYTRRIKK